MALIFLIPARGGSKRLPGKNKRLFCGIPLFMWSVATAHRVRGLDDLVITSSDDPDLIAWGADERSPELSSDDAKTEDLVNRYLVSHAVCLLQPTSPTRTDALVRMMIARGDACRSVTDGKPNGQCYVYRRGMKMIDVETECGHDIDTLEQFTAAEADMMRKFA